MARNRPLLLVLLLSLAVLVFSFQVFTYYGWDNVSKAVADLIGPQHLVKQVAASPPEAEKKPAESAAVPPSMPVQPPVSQVSPDEEDPVIQPVPEVTTPVAASAVAGVPAAGKRIALTFDDGPSPLTPEYLRVFREAGVHVTFFVVGSRLQHFYRMLPLMVADGHEIGDHSFSHRNLKLLPVSQACQDILEAARLIQQGTHRPVSLFRPPGGNVSPALVKVVAELGMKTVLWNVDPRDWSRGATPSKIIRQVMDHLRPGAIVVMHEGKLQTLAALPTLLKELKQGGWQVVTVSALLGGEQPVAVAEEPAAALPAPELLPEAPLTLPKP